MGAIRRVVLLGGLLVALACEPSSQDSRSRDERGPLLVLDSSKVRSWRDRTATTDSLRKAKGLPATPVDPIRVIEVQRLLARLGYGTMITGKVDAATIEAIRMLERWHGLPITGDIGSATFELGLSMVRDSAVEPLPLPEFRFFARDGIRAVGTFVQENGSPWPSIHSTSEITCSASACTETWGVNAGFGLQGGRTEYAISNRAVGEIIADERPGVWNCFLHRLTIAIADSSVTLTRLPGPNHADTTCEAERTLPPPAFLRLLDGRKVVDAAKAKLNRFSVMTAGARQALRSHGSASIAFSDSLDAAKQKYAKRYWDSVDAEVIARHGSKPRLSKQTDVGVRPDE